MKASSEDEVPSADSITVQINVHSRGKYNPRIILHTRVGDTTITIEQYNFLNSLNKIETP